MYQPDHFRMKEPSAIHQLMREHPLASLIVQTQTGMEANHIPLLLQPGVDGKDLLLGHVARANPLWREIDTEQEVLAIFHGPETYISPGWYPTKREHGKVVPTWNYVVAHAWGRLRVVDDAAWLRNLVGQLTTRHESRFEKPWSVEDAPADYIDKMVSAIVGIEITITRLEGKAKVSQNQPAVNREGVVQALTAQADADLLAMAAAINTSAPR
jgi:transcriptional regulator